MRKKGKWTLNKKIDENLVWPVFDLIRTYNNYSYSRIKRAREYSDVGLESKVGTCVSGSWTIWHN